jgi:hypothetical protein
VFGVIKNCVHRFIKNCTLRCSCIFQFCGSIHTIASTGCLRNHSTLVQLTNMISSDCQTPDATGVSQQLIRSLFPNSRDYESLRPAHCKRYRKLNLDRMRSLYTNQADPFQRYQKYDKANNAAHLAEMICTFVNAIWDRRISPREIATCMAPHRPTSAMAYRSDMCFSDVLLAALIFAARDDDFEVVQMLCDALRCNTDLSSMGTNVYGDYRLRTECWVHESMLKKETLTRSQLNIRPTRSQLYLDAFLSRPNMNIYHPTCSEPRKALNQLKSKIVMICEEQALNNGCN